MFAMTQDQILILIKLFEESLDKVSGLYSKAVEGIPVWELVHIYNIRQTQDWQRWLRRSGYAGMYRYVYLSRRFPVKVHAVPGVPMVKFSCPKTLAIKEVGHDDIAVYQVDEKKFLNAVIDSLKSKFDSFAENVRMCSKYVFYLGQAIMQESRQVPVFLIRGMKDARQEILDTLERENAMGLILCCSHYRSDQFRSPPGVQVRRLWDVLAGEPVGIDLNSPFSHALAISKPDTLNTVKAVLGDRGQALCSYNTVSRVLSVTGKPDWEVRGRRAGAIVEYLVDQAIKGRWEVPAKELLQHTKPGAGGAMQLPSIFNGKAGWREYISRPRRGYYGVNMVLQKNLHANDCEA